MTTVLAVLLLTSWELWATTGLLATVAKVALAAGAGGALLGWWPRRSLALAAVATACLGGLVQQGGAPVHLHHLLWFAVLLACGSLRGPGAESTRRVGVLLLGAVYFFPGLHKLHAADGGWLDGSTLRQHLHWKWAQSWDHTVPAEFPTDPDSLQLAALGVVVFELCFVFVALQRGYWLVAAGAALAFHAAAALVLDISFTNLWPLLVVLLPLQPDPGPRLSGWRRAALASLVAVVCLAGLSGEERAWPVACYPTFAQAPGAEMPVLAWVAVHDNDTRHPIPHTLLFDPEPSDWATQWRLSTGPADAAALTALWAEARSRPGVADHLAHATHIEVWAGALDTTPDARHLDTPPRRLRLLLSLPETPAR